VSFWTTFTNELKGIGTGLGNALGIAGGNLVNPISGRTNALTSFGIQKYAAPIIQAQVPNITAEAQQSMIGTLTDTSIKRVQQYDPLLQVANLAEKKVFNPAKRGLDTAFLLTDPTSPLYDNGVYGKGLQVSDLQAAYDRTKDVSLGVSVTKSWLNPFHVTGISDAILSTGKIDIDKVNLWDDKDVEKNFVQNPVGRWMSGANDAVLGNVVAYVATAGITKGAGALGRAAGLGTSMKSYDVNSLINFEKRVDDHLSGTTQTVLGDDITRLAASKDINQIMDILKPHTNNPRMPAIIRDTEDPAIVRDFILADKGYVPALERLAQAKQSDGLWVMSDAAAEISADYIKNGRTLEPNFEGRQRIAAAFDDSIAKNPAHQEIYDAFLSDRTVLGPVNESLAAQGVKAGDIDSVPRYFGNNYQPPEPIIGSGIYAKARGRVSELRAATVTRDFSNVGGMTQRIIGTKDVPTVLLKLVTTKMPRGMITNSGIRPNDAIEEINAHLDDLKLFSNGSNMIKISAKESIPASEYRRRLIDDYLTASSDSERGLVTDRLNETLIYDVAATYGVTRAEIQRLVEDSMATVRNFHNDLSSSSYAMDPSGVRYVTDSLTQPQLRNATPLVNVKTFEQDIINSKKSFSKTRSGVNATANFAYESGNKIFSFTQLVRPSYIGKNSVIEPLLVSVLSHGSRALTDEFASTIKNAVDNAKNRYVRAMESSNLGSIKSKRALADDFEKLSTEYKNTVQLLEDHVAEYAKYDIDPTGRSPQTKIEYGEIVKRDLNAAEKALRYIEEKMYDAAPEFTADIVKSPSLYNLTRRVKYLEEIASKQPVQEYIPPVITDTNELMSTLNSQRARGFTVENNKPLEDSLVNYTNGSGDYSLVNTVLRGEYKASEKEAVKVNKIVADLDSLISNAPVLEKPIITFRGLSSDRFSEEYLNGLSKLKPGDTFVEKSFSSTDLKETIGARFARDKGIVLEITNPAGTKGVFPIGFRTKVTEKFAKGESEWLLPRNTRFRVTEVNGNRIKVTITGVAKPQVNGSVQYASAIANAKAAIVKAAGDIETLVPNLKAIDSDIAVAYKNLENNIQDFGKLHAKKADLYLITEGRTIKYGPQKDATIVMPNGQKIEGIPQFGDKKYQGDGYRSEVANTHTRNIEITGDKVFAQKVNLLDRRGPKGVTDVSSPHYFDELAYVANTYMRGDVLVDRILSGQSRAELLEWGKTRQARSYAYEFGKDAKDIVSIIDNQISYINRYLPSAEAQALAARGQVTGGELARALSQNPELLTPIQPLEVAYSINSSGAQKFSDVIDQLSAKAWTTLATPENKFRYAWASREFKSKNAQKLESLIAQGYDIDATVINGIRQSAATEVVQELEKTFYSIRRNNRALYMARTVLAFPSAAASGIYRYSRLAVQNPSRFAVFLNSYYGLYNTFGVDKYGNDVKNPLDAAFLVVPGTKEMGINKGRGLLFNARATAFTVNFAGPSYLTPVALGQVYKWKQGSDVQVKKFIDSTVGKLPGYSYDELFPYGVETNAFTGFQRGATPGWLPTLRKYLLKDGDGSIDWINSLTSEFKYQQFQYDAGIGPKPTDASVVNQTRKNYLVKFAWQFGSIVGSPAYVETKPMGVFQDLFNAKANAVMAMKKDDGTPYTRTEAAQIAEDYVNTTLRLPKGTPVADIVNKSAFSKTTYIPRSQEAIDRIWNDYSGLAKELGSLDKTGELVGLITADLPKGTNPQAGRYLDDPNRTLPGGGHLNNPVKTVGELKNNLEISRYWAKYVGVKDKWDKAAKDAGYASYRSVPELVAGLKSYAADLGKESPVWNAVYKKSLNGDNAVVQAIGIQTVLNNKKFNTEFGNTQFWQDAQALLKWRDAYVKASADAPSGYKGKVQESWVQWLDENRNNFDPALMAIIDRYFMNDNLTSTNVKAKSFKETK